MKRKALTGHGLALALILAAAIGTASPAGALPPVDSEGPGEVPGPVATAEDPAPVTEVTEAPMTPPLISGGVVAAPPVGGYDDRWFNAPTPGHRTIASSLRLGLKSVTSVITLPAGLNVGATEIGVRYTSATRTQQVTQSYVNGTGNRFLYNFPEESGVKRVDKITVSIKQGAVVYVLNWNVPIEPLFDVTYGTLKFVEIGECDLLSKVDPVVFYKAVHERRVELHLDDFQTALDPTFAGTIKEVGSSQKRRTHDLWWFDGDDPSWLIISFHYISDFQPGPPLLPGKPTVVKHRIAEPGDSSCIGEFSFNLTYALRTYPFL